MVAQISHGRPNVVDVLNRVYDCVGFIVINGECGQKWFVFTSFFLANVHTVRRWRLVVASHIAVRRFPIP